MSNLTRDMNAVALLYTVALAVAETGGDASTAAREFVRVVGADAADGEAVAAAAGAIDRGRPVRAVARELVQVLHADVDTFAADVFRAYVQLPQRRRNFGHQHDSFSRNGAGRHIGAVQTRFLEFWSQFDFNQNVRDRIIRMMSDLPLADGA